MVGTSTACGGGYQTGGNGFSLALLKNGTVMAWGSDCNGQVGFEGKGARNDVYTPTQVEVKGDKGQLSPLTGVAEVAAGPNFSFALMKTGTVMAWGANAFGELGIGKRAYSERSKHSNPTAVEVKGPNDKLAPLTGVVAIGAWNGGGFARKSDGTMWAWGSRFDGAVGDGTTGGLTDTAVRVAIPNSMTVNRIGTGCNAKRSRFN